MTQYRHSVVDGRVLVATTDTMEDAIRIAHDHELMQLHLYNRLTICDILSRPVKIFGETIQ